MHLYQHSRLHLVNTTNLLNVGLHVVAVDVHPSTGEQLVAGQHLECGRLAGAVDAEEAEALALGDADAEVVDCADRVVVLHHLLQHQPVRVEQLAQGRVQHPRPLRRHVAVLLNSGVRAVQQERVHLVEVSHLVEQLFKQLRFDEKYQTEVETALNGQKEEHSADTFSLPAQVVVVEVNTRVTAVI